MRRFGWSWPGLILFLIGSTLFGIAVDLPFWQDVLAVVGIAVMAEGVNS